MVNEKLKEICSLINRGEIRGNKSSLIQLASDGSLLDKLKCMSAGQFAWHIVNDTWQIPVCKVCGGTTKFNAHRRKYAPTCSKTCGYSDPDRVKKIASTMEEKYGVANAAYSPGLMEKKKQTLLDALGVDHPSKSPIIKLQKKKTMMENWGVDNPSKSSEIQQRKIQTNREKRGVDWAPQDPAVIAKNKQTCLERYGVPHSRYRYNTPEQIRLLSDKDSFIEFITDQNIYEVAEKLGVSTKTIYVLTAHYDCRSLLKIDYNSNSSYERKIKDFLDGHDIQYVANSRTIIPPFEIDIFIPDKNIAIEVGSGFWHSDRYGRDRKYHQNKWKMCRDKNITLFQWFDEDIILNWHLTESRLRRALQMPVPVVGARKVQITTCTHDEEIEFLDKWHAKGHSINRNVVLACKFNEQIVGIMTMKHNIKNNQAIIERWATDTTRSWPGLFSKTLMHWIRTTNFKGKIQTWCDNRLGDGQVYSSAGFKKAKVSDPGYWYFKGIGLESRVKYQKHKLQKIFALSDEDMQKSEWEIMQAHGYDRLWDAGHTLWLKRID